MLTLTIGLDEGGEHKIYNRQAFTFWQYLAYIFGLFMFMYSVTRHLVFPIFQKIYFGQVV